jgi:hypothetical protein
MGLAAGGFERTSVGFSRCFDPGQHVVKRSPGNPEHFRGAALISAHTLQYLNKMTFLNFFHRQEFVIIATM